MYTLSEAGIVFITTAQGSRGDEEEKWELPPGHKRIEASVVFEIFCPSLGFTGIMPDMTLQVVDGDRPRSKDVWK